MKRLLGFLLTLVSLVVGSCYSANNNTQLRVQSRKNVEKKETNEFDFYETKIVDVSAGWSHNLALDQDGGLWVWGNNEQGQLGDGTTTTSYVPKQIMKGHKFRFIEAGKGCSAAIDLNGYLYVWGETQNLIETEEILLEPTLVSDIVRYRSVHYDGQTLRIVSENEEAIQYFGIVAYDNSKLYLKEDKKTIFYYSSSYEDEFSNYTSDITGAGYGSYDSSFNAFAVSSNFNVELLRGYPLLTQLRILEIFLLISIKILIFSITFRQKRLN